jgi:hypothetical protein
MDILSQLWYWHIYLIIGMLLLNAHLTPYNGHQCYKIVCSNRMHYQLCTMLHINITPTSDMSI